MNGQEDKEKEILVTRSSLPSYEEYIEMIKPIWDSAWLTNMGDFHKQLEKELKEYMEIRNMVLFVNGHMALEMAIQALELTGEVITTPFSFASTTHAIVRNNLTPVFCDIRPEDYTMDPEKIEALITDKTSAIMPVHVYGNLCDVERIEAIARKHGLRVIYDAAHTFGERYKGKSVAEFGDASIFSFHATGQAADHGQEGGLHGGSGEQITGKIGKIESVTSSSDIDRHNQTSFLVSKFFRLEKLNAFSHGIVQPASSGPGDRQAQAGGGTLSVRPGRRAGYQAAFLQGRAYAQLCLLPCAV